MSLQHCNKLQVYVAFYLKGRNSHTILRKYCIPLRNALNYKLVIDTGIIHFIMFSPCDGELIGFNVTCKKK